MSDQKSRLILSILMLIGVLTVVAASLGWLGQDTTPQHLAIAPGNTASNGMPAHAKDPRGTSDLKQVTINLTEPSFEAGNPMRRWPAESAIQVIHQTDLSTYVDRPVAERPLAGITVFLDPGHGGSDSGATYPPRSIANSQNRAITEAEINLAVALRIKVQLQDLGASVYLIREDDVWQSIFYRIAYVSRFIVDQFSAEMQTKGYASDAIDQFGPLMDQIMAANNDFESTGGRGIMNGVGAIPELKLLLDIEHQYPEVLFLSIHCNSVEDDESARGLQVFYLSGETAYQKERELSIKQSLADSPPAYMMYRDESRARLAGLIRSGILNRMPDLKYNGQADLLEENYAVLRELNLTSALIELGFISNAADRAILQDASQQQVMAESIAEAVYHFYCN